MLPMMRSARLTRSRTMRRQTRTTVHRTSATVTIRTNTTKMNGMTPTIMPTATNIAEIKTRAGVAVLRLSRQYLR